jgi:hypothetical protein
MTDARPADPSSMLSNADALAETGDWPGAIEAWRCAADQHPELRPAVERRLEWFLSETGQYRIGRPRILLLVLAFLVSTVLGTMFLMFAERPGSLSSNLWAVAAWAMIAVATVAALLAARRSGETPLGHLVASARRGAEHSDREPAPGETT